MTYEWQVMNQMGKNDERERAVLEFLKTHEKLNTADVTAMLNISESSARRLFLSMEKSGRVVRVLGGIQLSGRDSAGASYSFIELENKNLAEKRSIALLAANRIQSGDIVYLDSGTTLFQLALAIKERLIRHDLQDIRVITNSLANMDVLDDVCEVILTGGRYRAKRKDFAGYATERFIQCFNYGKAFLGADGFDFDEGFMGTDTETARLNEILLTRSNEIHVLIDSSKIGIRSFVTYAATDRVTSIMTDERLSAQDEMRCLQQGITMIKAAAK